MIAGKRVVYTSGTFDMLHVNHLKMIQYARALGDLLIVGVNTDELVATYKSAPIIPFEQRIELIKALKWPDIVIPQKSLDHTDKVKKLNMDVFVIGDDWAGKYDYLKDLGVDSSSKLKREIAEKYSKLVNVADTHFSNDIDVKNH